MSHEEHFDVWAGMLKHPPLYPFVCFWGHQETNFLFPLTKKVKIIELLDKCIKKHILYTYVQKVAMYREKSA